ncbi:heavy-metal-associated domain-containing protein [Sphingomonas bacterium]|uniref:heavy-metal-associated domain-containing protein n=1 Tax=Sphingomonas bacterium TaxID=1895847 RepID=UPI0015771B1C|nr:heavy-metal-associated domain-containing protein [Sphingomonas bacterium]
MSRFLPRLWPAIAAAALAAGAVVAQVEGGNRGVAPVDSSGAYEVDGVGVDVSAATAAAARYAGWRIAQRKAWNQLSQRLSGSASSLSDGALDGLVSSIVVENEQIGPTRYIARLGVLFDRERAGTLLGISSYTLHSPPMLVIPVQWSGGVGQVFQQRTPWQQAWARYRTSNSAIDYIRPSGNGPDSLLLTAGQVGRRGRAWWRTLIDQYGASDVLIPTVRLYRQWPGGPVIGVFEARHGPDGALLTGFTLRVGNADGLPQLMDAGVKRMDDAYQEALRTGDLRPDVALSPPPPAAAPDPVEDDAAGGATDTAAEAVPVSQVSIQYDSAGVGAVSATEALVRSIAGVRSAVTASLALGGTSVMRVAFAGDPDLLKAQLQARGLQVFGSGATLRIRRAPQLLPPDLSPDNPAAG